MENLLITSENEILHIESYLNSIMKIKNINYLLPKGYVNDLKEEVRFKKSILSEIKKYYTKN